MVFFKKGVFFAFLAVVLMLASCAQNTVVTDTRDELDKTIREASDYLNEHIPAGNKIVVLNIVSDSDALSEYIIEELVANAINDKNFTVVDRKQLDDIREEQHFQISGEVGDAQAVNIGKLFGAQSIVSGQVTPFGGNYRFSVRALSVESAQVQGQFNKNIPATETISALMRVPNVYKPPVVTPPPTPPSTNAFITPPPPPPPAKPTLTNPPVDTGVTPPRPTVQPPTVESSRKYNIGDIGPAGGRIFYDKGSYTDGWRYMEAAPVTHEFTATWGLNGVYIPTRTKIGTGRWNTELILRELRIWEQSEKAANMCEALVINGFNDWFLPSKDELYEMYKNIHHLDLWPGSNYYWTSSQGNNSYRTWAIRFNKHYFYNHYLNNRATHLYVRAVRTF